MSAAEEEAQVGLALERLFQAVPERARLCNGAVPVITTHHLYAVVENRTLCDQEIDRRKTRNSIRLVRLPGQQRSDTLLARTDDCKIAIKVALENSNKQDCQPLQVLLRLLDSGSQPEMLISELETYDDQLIRSLCRTGWLIPSRSTTRAGLDEAPSRDEDKLLWSFPRCGIFFGALLKARSEVLRVLKKQTFCRAEYILAERATTKTLKKEGMSLQYVLCNMEGMGLVRSYTLPGPGGGIGTLELSPAGVEASRSLPPPKRKRT